MTSVWLWVTTILFFIVGLVGTIVPGVPGIGLVFLGILIFAAATSFATVSISTVLLAGAVVIVATLADYFGSALGSKAGGGGKLAVVGTIIGTFFGFALGPVGIFLGAFSGGFVGAALEGATGEKAMKVAAYSTIGVLGAMVVQFVLALVLIISFFATVFS